jgi:hypothetical protein
MAVNKHLQKRAELSIVQTTGGKVSEAIEETTLGGFFKVVADLRANGWKIENEHLLDGSINVKMSGKSYGVKSTIKGKLKLI